MSAALVVVIAFAIFIVVVMIVRVFNHLVLVKHNVQRAWADIGVLLRQRQEELGKLIVVCRAHADYEKDALERVAKARGEMQQALSREFPAAVWRAERAMRQDLGEVIARGEAHPVLKADEGFQHLSKRVNALENAIADRREFYNSTVEINNNAIESFPEILLAAMFGFRAAEFMGFDARRKR